MHAYIINAKTEKRTDTKTIPKKQQHHTEIAAPKANASKAESIKLHLIENITSPAIATFPIGTYESAWTFNEVYSH